MVSGVILVSILSISIISSNTSTKYLTYYVSSFYRARAFEVAGPLDLQWSRRCSIIFYANASKIFLAFSMCQLTFCKSSQSKYGMKSSMLNDPMVVSASNTRSPNPFPSTPKFSLEIFLLAGIHQIMLEVRVHKSLLTLRPWRDSDSAPKLNASRHTTPPLAHS